MRRSHRYLAGVTPYAEVKQRRKWYFDTAAAEASSARLSGSEYQRSIRSRARRTCTSSSVGTAVEVATTQGYRRAESRSCRDHATARGAIGARGCGRHGPEGGRGLAITGYVTSDAFLGSATATRWSRGGPPTTAGPVREPGASVRVAWVARAHTSTRGGGLEQPGSAPRG